MKPTHDAFLAWLDNHKNNINALISPQLLVTNEYDMEAGEQHLLMDADIQLSFNINGAPLSVYHPVFASFSLDGDKLKLSIKDRENSDPLNLFGELVDDFHCEDDEDSNEILDALFLKMDKEFYEYFNLEQIPSWETRLIESIIHEDLPMKLKELTNETA